jgi:hypothetical protein
VTPTYRNVALLGIVLEVIGDQVSDKVNKNSRINSNRVYSLVWSRQPSFNIMRIVYGQLNRNHLIMFWYVSTIN